MATTIVNYVVARNLIRQSIVDNELPLTSDNIYSEIQKDLVRPIFISSMMAGDTFLRDWVLAGENDVSRITRYLAEVRQRYGAHTSFLVSDKSSKYYQADGILKQVKRDEPRDVWYYRVQGMATPYEINVDPDMAAHDRLTIFVNYRVLDYSGNFIGATGVGLSVDAVRKLVKDYQERYQRTIYFVDKQGKVALFASNHSVEKNIQDNEGLRDVAPEILSGKEGAYVYHAGGTTHLLNVRYIPELHWYLFVEKQEDAELVAVRQTLYLNLLISVVITVLVLVLVNLAIGRYQTRLENLALTDKLTGLANRQALDMAIQRDIAESKRSKVGIAAILIDLDHFKVINDTHGHLAGDAVLSTLAASVRAQLREGDLIGRWGGEEFLVMLRDTDLDAAMLVAEKIRKCVETTETVYAEQHFRLTTSLGVALLRDGDTQDSLINRADRALYAAKQDGRNRVRVG
ncbi:MAG TPA: sensor domain-containing diguanylate cyclase [Rhodocyclaceae bacterium]|nr:sensor domain-containing diguanylate cyclase [Rhodocyclaceae bacterium]